MSSDMSAVDSPGGGALETGGGGRETELAGCGAAAGFFGSAWTQTDAHTWS